MIVTLISGLAFSRIQLTVACPPRVGDHALLLVGDDLVLASRPPTIRSMAARKILLGDEDLFVMPHGDEAPASLQTLAMSAPRNQGLARQERTVESGSSLSGRRCTSKSPRAP